LTPIDVQLLEILQHDATQTPDELGETVGLSGSADYRRITGELLDADANVLRFVSHVALGTVKASLAVPLEPHSA